MKDEVKKSYYLVMNAHTNEIYSREETTSDAQFKMRNIVSSSNGKLSFDDLKVIGVKLEMHLVFP